MNAEASQMYRNIGKESAIMMIILAAREYGIGPAQALNGGLHIIEGKVELSARMMSGLIRRARHQLNIIESSDKKCSIRGLRSDTGESHIANYTIEEAQNAGLIKEKGAWKRCPIDMLYARALSRLARQLFSDVIGIGYVEGEISAPRVYNEEIEPSVNPSIESPLDPLEEDKMLDELTLRFLAEDVFLVIEWMKQVQENRGWSRLHTLEQLLQDKVKTSQAFETWKSKRSV